MYKKAIRILILSITTMAIPAISEAEPVKTGTLFLQADSDSYVGGGIGGIAVLWTHGEEGLFKISTNFDKGALVSFSNGSMWSFNFAAPSFNAETNTDTGNNLEVKYYDEATRFPYNSSTKPGLDFRGNGRGNIKLGGSFNVLEVEYNKENEFLRLAVDFRQYDESEDRTGPSTFGSLRINSTIPINTTGMVQVSDELPETQEYPEYDLTTQLLKMPVVKVGDVYYKVTMKGINDKEGLVFKVHEADMLPPESIR